MGEITEFVANSDAQKSGLLSRVASDKGYVGVHSAGDSFRGCPEYRAFVDGHIVNRLAEMRHDVEAVENMHGPARLLGVERAEFAKTSSGNEYSVSSEPKYPFPTEARHAAGIPSGGGTCCPVRSSGRFGLPYLEAVPVRWKRQYPIILVQVENPP